MKHLPEIHFKSIPHNEHRYSTVGDYYEQNGQWEFRVSQMSSDEEFLVFIHELVEWYLTQKKGVTEPEIDSFDRSFEELREKYPEIIGDQEPGHMVSAPYHNEHVFAEQIEMLVASKLGVDWNEYSKTVEDL